MRLLCFISSEVQLHVHNIYHKERNIPSTELTQSFIYFTSKVNIIG